MSDITGLSSAEAEAALLRFGRNTSSVRVCQRRSCFCFPRGPIQLAFYEKCALFKREVDFNEWKKRETPDIYSTLWPGHKASSYRVLRDGMWQDVSIELLVPGDIIQLRKDDRMPVDGKLVALPEGTSLTVDQSGLTGEAEPVSCQVGGDNVMLEGSRILMAPENGALLRVTETGSSTFLNKALFIEASSSNVKSWVLPSDDPLVKRLVDEFQASPYNRA